MLETYKSQTPLYIFEAVASQYATLHTLTKQQKHEFVAKLYFYTQQETKNLDTCYNLAGIERTNLIDVEIKKHITALANFHETDKCL
jgi:hypothetical protein